MKVNFDLTVKDENEIDVLEGEKKVSFTTIAKRALLADNDASWTPHYTFSIIR